MTSEAQVSLDTLKVSLNYTLYSMSHFTAKPLELIKKTLPGLTQLAGYACLHTATGPSVKPNVVSCLLPWPSGLHLATKRPGFFQGGTTRSHGLTLTPGRKHLPGVLQMGRRNAGGAELQFAWKCLQTEHPSSLKARSNLNFCGHNFVLETWLLVSYLLQQVNNEMFWERSF